MKKNLLFTFSYTFIVVSTFFALTKVNLKNDFNIKPTFLNTKNKDTLAPSAATSGTKKVYKENTEPQITFTGTDGVAPYTFTYTINGGSDATETSTVKTESVNVSTASTGAFIYALVSDTDSSGITKLANETATITIGDKPDVDFNFNNNNTCSGTSLNFTSTAIGLSPFKYLWDFGDGKTSNLANPTHVFEALGCGGTQDFNVKLTVTDDNGSSNSVTKVVTVNKKPELTFVDLDFDVNDPFDIEPFNNCGNNTTNQTYTINVGIGSGSATCISSYDVDWGDGSPIQTNVSFPLSHPYTKLGTFKMEITGIGFNCNNTVTYNIKNSSNPRLSLENPGNTVNLCAPSESLSFAIGSWGNNPPDTTYEVDFGDGIIENYKQTDLEASSFFNATNPASSQNFPIPHTYTDASCPTDYFVIVKAKTSCGESKSSAGPIVVLRKPEVAFEDPPIGCVNKPVQFINSSLDGFNNNCITKDVFTWDFGDGTTSNLKSPTHSYTSKGTYTVSLFGENGCGKTNTITKTICIEPELTAAFNLDTNNGCSPLAVQTTNTTDLSASCGGDVFLWEVAYTANFCGTEPPQWRFTNGTNQNSVSPSLEFTTAGTYTLTLTTTNSCGNKTVSQTIDVKEPPKVTLDAIPDVCNSTLTINPVANVNSCAPASEAISYKWTFTDGTPSSASTLNPGSITYTSPGTYQVILDVTTSCGTTTVTEDFELFPTLSITNTNLDQTVCQNLTPTDLEVTLSGGLGTNFTFQWFSNTINSNSGGIAIPTATNSTFTPPTSTVGTLYYYVEVTQTDSGCNVVSNASEVIVNAAPTITQHPISESICLGGTFKPISVNFINGLGSPSYQWYSNTVNDTTTGVALSGETNATFTPPSNTAGTVFYYVVIKFIATDCNEITSNISVQTVNETPSITDKLDTICSGESFNITPTTTGTELVPAGTLYTWNLPVITPLGAVSGASNETTGIDTISQTLINNTTSPATVVYTVTPTSGTCSGATFNVTITVNPSINITETITNSSCFEIDNGSIEISISGGVPFTTGNPYQISWTGPNSYTNTDEDIFNLEPGSYTLNIIDDGGCPFTKTFTITEPSKLIFSTINFDPETISCFGANNGTIRLDVSGGTLPYTYNWTRNGTAFATTKDIDNLEPGIYEITVTDKNSCTPITQSFQIIEPPLLEVSLASKVDVTCFGDATSEINIAVTGGRPIEVSPGVFDYSYAWTGPNGFTSNLQNLTNLFSGIYDVIVTDASGCKTTLQVTLYQADEINIDFTKTDIVCYGDTNASITINNITGGIPPYTTTWSNFGSGMFQNNLSAGTYTITVTDKTNCQKDFEVIINEPPVFKIAPVVSQITCFGSKNGRIILNFEGSMMPITILWSDDATAGVERNNLGPGTYKVTITNGTACQITETFVISEPALLNLSAIVTDALSCDDANSGAINLIVTGGTLPLTYTWSNGTTTEDLNNTPPGTYNVLVTDANGCTASGSWTINKFKPLTVNVETNTAFNCENRTVNQTFMGMVNGGVPPYQFNWSSGTVSGTNNEFMNTSQNGLVILTVTDNLGCSTNYSFNVDIPVIGFLGFTQNSLANTDYGFYSKLDPIQFTNTATGNYESFLWNFGDGNFSSEENPIHAYAIEGTYEVTLTVTYPFGCVYNQQITLIIEKGYSLIIPDGFTPNNDGINDYFTPKYIALSAMTFNVYDTWGSLVYSENGDNLKGWNGNVSNTKAENGNYYYTFSGKTLYGKTITKEGAIVVIK